MSEPTAASAPADYAARYMDGRSGAVYQGHAAFTDGGLAFTDGSQAVTWPYGEIRLLDGSVGSDWLSLALADDSPARLRLSGAALAELRRRCTALRAPTTADRRGRRLVLWWSLAALAGLAVTFLLLPWASAVIARSISPDTEQAFGSRVFAGFEQVAAARGGRGAVCETAAGQAALQRLVARLSQPPPRLPLQVRVIRHGMINAFALPGGYIVLTEGLLRFVGSDGELAGVIAHEIGHVDAGHAMAAAIRSGATGLLVGLLFGDVVGGIGSVTVAEHLLHAAYTRDLEDEADHLALQRLRQSGIDPAGMAAFFRRLAGKAGEGMPALLSTHPDTAIRAARFAAAAQPASPLLAPAEWQALKDICRS